MALIEGIYAREILDSRGVPTIECTLWMDNGGIVATSVPTGTSVGKYEAKELRDNDPNRMLGKGVLNAVNYINSYIAPQLINKNPEDQEAIDQLLNQLDGTPNKAKLGANSILAVSQAVLKAGALASNMPLYYYVHQKFNPEAELMIPSCIYTVINGGSHGADNLDIQEFQIVPASHIDFQESLNMAATLYQKLEEVLILKGAIHSVGLVGGFTPNLYSNSDVFEILVETIKSSPYTFAQDLFFGIDVAASEIFSNGKYKLKDRSQPYKSNELLEYYKKIRSMYNVFYIEDPFQEDDKQVWQRITDELGETTKIVGDSLLATDKTKTQEAIKEKLCNTLLVKPNQVGTITETIEVMKIARGANWQTVMSHRSGETNDDLIADLAVGVGANYAKFGPTNRGERIAKYNRLLQIHQELLQINGTTQSTQQTQAPQVAPTPEPATQPQVPQDPAVVQDQQANIATPAPTANQTLVAPPVAPQTPAATPSAPTTAPVAATPPQAPVTSTAQQTTPTPPATPATNVSQQTQPASNITAPPTQPNS